MWWWRIGEHGPVSILDIGVSDLLFALGERRSGRPMSMTLSSGAEDRTIGIHATIRTAGKGWTSVNSVRARLIRGAASIVIGDRYRYRDGK